MECNRIKTDKGVEVKPNKVAEDKSNYNRSKFRIRIRQKKGQIKFVQRSKQLENLTEGTNMHPRTEATSN